MCILIDMNIKFQIETNEPFVALNSNSLTSKSFQLEVNTNECYAEIQTHNYEKINHFDLKIVLSKSV
jgi:hypothetical protein